MPVFEITSPDGRKFRVNGPEGSTKEQALEKVKMSLESQPDPEAPGATVGGVAAEGIKGVLRGASDTARMIPQAISGVMGPALGPLFMKGVDALAAPGRELIKAGPQNEAEKMMATGSEIAGAVAAGGPGGGVKRAAANILAPAVGGVVGEQIAGDTGKVVGALTPAAIQTAAVPLAQKAGQAIASRVAPRIEQFKQAGSFPSVGQATELNFFQGFESLLSKFPGGQGVFRKFAENQQAKLGATAKTGVSAEDAGRSIEKGIKGEGGFIERTKETWTALDQKLADKVGTQYKVPPVNTQAALEELGKPIAGAESTSATLVNPKVAAIREAFMADVQNNMGGMPFEALRQLRTKIGSMVDDALVSGVPAGEMKKLYGAMSKDLEAGAKAVGAGEEFARQSNFYKARIDRIENVLERVLGKTPEETFKRFMPTDQDQVTKVRAVMRSLDPEQRKIVTDAVVNRLGRANPSKQDAVGAVFSPETFLTNWNRLSDGAKAQIYADQAMRKNMDSLAGVTENLRSGAKVFAQPSGSAGAAAPYGMGYLLAVGNVATVGTLAGGAMIGAKMLTSPKTVEWLARSPKVPPGQEATHIARLGAIYNETRDPELKQELGDYLKSVSPQ